jgi:hypothetical protein
VTLSLTARVETTEVVFWGEGGIARMPDDDDLGAAYPGAIDALLADDTRFGASFARDVVHVSADAEERIGIPLQERDSDP